MTTESPALTFTEVTPVNWPAFESFFEAKGHPKYCWCMAWRVNAEEAKLSGKDRKDPMRERIQAGTPVGLLGRLSDEAVAWCSVAPRSTFRGLVKDGGPDDGIWSITCFFVNRKLRGQGLSKQLLAAAIDHARARGAKVVEAYPVDPDSPSYRFMGFVSMFDEAGFDEVGREGSRRHVMRLDLAEDAEDLLASEETRNEQNLSFETVTDEMKRDAKL